MDKLFDDEVELGKWATYSKRFGAELNFDGSVDPFVLEMCKRDHARKVIPPATPSLDYLFARLKVAERSLLMLKADVAKKYKKKRKFKRNLKMERLEWKFISECCGCPPLRYNPLSREVNGLTNSDLGFGRLALNDLGRTRQQTEHARAVHIMGRQAPMPKSQVKKEKQE